MPRTDSYCVYLSGNLTIKQHNIQNVVIAPPQTVLLPLHATQQYNLRKYFPRKLFYCLDEYFFFIVNFADGVTSFLAVVEFEFTFISRNANCKQFLICGLVTFLPCTIRLFFFFKWYYFFSCSEKKKSMI